MFRHAVETIPDDLEALGRRLDQLSEGGSQIVAVMWRALNVVEDQGVAAMQGRGSFVIVSQTAASGYRGEMERLSVDPEHDGP